MSTSRNPSIPSPSQGNQIDCSDSVQFRMQSQQQSEGVDCGRSFADGPGGMSRQNSIEKILNDVIIPPPDPSPKMSYPHAASSDGADNVSGDSSTNLQSPLGSDELDIDLSSISPLSSVQAQNASNISGHPYFSTLDNRQRAEKPSARSVAA